MSHWSRALLIAVAACAAACGGTPESEPTREESVRPAPPAPSEVADAVGPHEVENDAGRHRGDLPPAVQAYAERSAAVVLSVLTEVRRAGDIGTESVAAALLAAGFDADRIVVNPGSAASIVVFAVRLDRGACVFGDVRPTRVLVDTGPPIPESGCAEPPFNH